MRTWLQTWFVREEETAGKPGDPLARQLREEAAAMRPTVSPVLHQRVMQAVSAAQPDHGAPSTIRLAPWLVPAMGVAAVIAAVIALRPPETQTSTLTAVAPTPMGITSPAISMPTLPDSPALVQKLLAAPYQKELANLSADARAILQALPIDWDKL